MSWSIACDEEEGLWDINQLSCFISVAETLNFSEAARRNYVSQSSVSRYISDLEKEFGVKLFSRSHRDVVITNEGKTLLPYAIEIVNTIGKAKTIINQLRNGGRGKITLGCDITSLWFPSKCVSDFRKKYPDITIELKTFEAADRSQGITGGEYDFCFMPRDMVPESSEIETLVTHTEPLVAVTQKGGAKTEKSVNPAQLADKKLVLLSESVAPIVYMEIVDLLRTFHISPEIDSSYNELAPLCIAVSSGLGISVLPRSLAELSSGAYADLIPFGEADTGIAYAAVWSKSISNPVAELFIKTIKQYAHGDDSIYEI